MSTYTVGIWYPRDRKTEVLTIEGTNAKDVRRKVAATLREHGLHGYVRQVRVKKDVN